MARPGGVSGIAQWQSGALAETQSRRVDDSGSNPDTGTIGMTDGTVDESFYSIPITNFTRNIEPRTGNYDLPSGARNIGWGTYGANTSGA